MGDEDPNFFFNCISRLETTMRAAGIEKSESEVDQIKSRQLLERYDVGKTMTLADPQLTRTRLENTIRSACCAVRTPTPFSVVGTRRTYVPIAHRKCYFVQ